MRRTLTAMACGLLAIALAAGAGATAVQDADEKELAAYRLTKEGLDRYAAVMKTLLVEMKTDPRFAEIAKIQAEIDRLHDKDELTAADEKRLEELEAKLEQLDTATALSLGDGSLSELEAQIRKNPTMTAALKTGGMAPREFAKFSIVLFQASMAVGMQRAGLLKELPKEIAAENVRFVEQHEKELEALQRQLEALSGERDR
jgi:hypothetical protein